MLLLTCVHLLQRIAEQIFLLSMSPTVKRLAYCITHFSRLSSAYPSAKCVTIPSVDNGFYYDFEVEKPFTSEDLEKIKAEMKKIVKSGIEIERFELALDEAGKNA